MRYLFEGQEYTLTFRHYRTEVRKRKPRQITEAIVQREDGSIRHRTVAILNPVDRDFFTKDRGRFYAVKKMEKIMDREEYALLTSCYFNRKEIEKGRKLSPPTSPIPEFNHA